MRKVNFVLLIPAFLALGMAAFAAEKPPVDAVNKDSRGLALKGYDPVAYFVDSKPAEGSKDITLDWSGATWRFASEKNRELFKAEPAKYAPQFGGYCAWAVGQNYTATADPQAWKIVDGKLYVNYNKDVQKKWDADNRKLIEAGGKNWPALHK